MYIRKEALEEVKSLSDGITEEQRKAIFTNEEIKRIKEYMPKYEKIPFENDSGGWTIPGCTTIPTGIVWGDPVIIKFHDYTNDMFWG